MQLPSSKKVLLILIALLTWFAIGLQLYPIIEKGTMPFITGIIHFISFFTIQSNIIVATAVTVLLVGCNKWFQFFSKPQVLTAIAVYILVVFLVYNIVLRSLWKPEGWQLIADNLLHVINPLLFIIYWGIYVPGKSLRYQQIIPWLWYPFIYLVYVLIRGFFTGVYPYPFVDAVQHGYATVLLNAAILFVVFIVLSCLFILLGRLKRI